MLWPVVHQCSMVSWTAEESVLRAHTHGLSPISLQGWEKSKFFPFINSLYCSSISECYKWSCFVYSLVCLSLVSLAVWLYPQKRITRLIDIIFTESYIITNIITHRIFVHPRPESCKIPIRAERKDSRILMQNLAGIPNLRTLWKRVANPSTRCTQLTRLVWILYWPPWVHWSVMGGMRIHSPQLD